MSVIRSIGLTSLTVIAALLPSNRAAQVQEFLPSAPADRSLVYVLDRENKLVALPFEAGTTPINSSAVAKETKTSFIEIRGEHAPTILREMPRWFLFTSQRTG